MTGEIWSIAVDAPLGPLHYLVPDGFDRSVVGPGHSVLVPLGKRKVAGLMLRKEPNAPEGVKLKAALQPIPERPPLSATYLQWLEWVSRYYVYPLGQTADLIFPPLPKGGGRRKSKKGAVVKPSTGQTDHSVNLTETQQAIVETISPVGAQDKPEFQTHLLFGVTGSGKTEVYMELIARVTAAGKQALVLVPEIALTPQLIERFARRFGDDIAVIHSHLTPREKTDNWWAAVNGEKSVLIGARSALFCPLPRLGIIVIDEEHESSFKQDESLRYHARDSAVMLAKLNQIPIVLGSATPSMESWHNATSGRYRLHRLPQRAKATQLPSVEVIDMRATRDRDRQLGSREDGRPFWASQQLLTAISETLERKEQAALFLNRRGIAQSVVCPVCGHSPDCPNCAVALTLHGRSDLICHYCDYHESLREHCSKCHDGEPKPLGLGTELIERDLTRLFPEARLLRMDRDEIQTREDLEHAISAIENREIDILVGTQMIAKGLDFPGLTTVGMVMADVAFNLPDFRASERAFQLLTQVAGRAGRHLHDRAGRVLLQTYNPDHPSIRFTLAHDYEGFAAYELEFRKPLDYPPAGRVAAIKFMGPSHDETEHAAFTVAQMARKMVASLEGKETEVFVLGPAPAPLAKLRNQYRFQILLKSHGPGSPISSLCRTLSESLAHRISPKVKVGFDIDALHLL